VPPSPDPSPPQSAAYQGGFFVPGHRPEPVAGRFVRAVRELEKAMPQTTIDNPSDPDFDSELRDEICQWLRDNGIDPALVPADERPDCSFRDGENAPHGGHTITTRVHIRTMPDSQSVMFRFGANRLEEATITKPMKVAPSTAVQAWLTARCSTCGR
jgi:hypothetical protein